MVLPFCSHSCYAVLTKKTKKEEPSSQPETRGLVLLSLCLLALLCLFSFHAEDRAANWLGVLGHGFAWILSYLFGLSVWPIIGYAGYMGWKLLLKGEAPGAALKSFYFGLLIVSLSVLLNLASETGMPAPGALKHKILTESVEIELPYLHRSVRRNLGGVPLYYLYRDLPLFNLQKMLSDVGIGITFSLTGLVSFLLLTNIRIVPLVRSLAGRKSETAGSPPLEKIERSLSKPAVSSVQEPSASPELRIRTLEEPEDKAMKRQAALRAQKVYNGDFASYQIPPPSLLTSAKKVDQPLLKKELRRQAEILEESLMSFGIEAKVGDINCGPTITSFEVHPAVGVKVQKITALENDIALKLQAKSIRIIAPIPGKAAVGVEIPSPYPQEVSFKEMLLAYQQGPRKSHIPILL